MLVRRQPLSVATSIKRFFSGTLLSRISGMVRDLTMAFAFGDHPSVAAFMVAFRLSNLFRRLLGEGPFQSAFIPHFEGLRVQDSNKASHFFRKITLLMLSLLLLITLASEGAIAALLSYGNLSADNQEIARLTGWLFPAIIFICLYGLNISLLNCFDSFFLPSFAPFICNFVWIVAAFFLRTASTPSAAMISLSKWVVIGFLGQWLLTFPSMLKHVAANWREWMDLKIPPEIKSLARSFLLGAVGVGAVQINAFFDALFARSADIRGPAYLWYSIRLEQLALAIFGIACVSTIIPRLSRAIKSSHTEEAQQLFSSSFSRIMAVMIPCTFAIIALGASSINLLYGRGSFSNEAVAKTTLCLWSYSLGLVPTTLIILCSSIFYAQGNFRLPMIISVGTVVLNVALNTLFVFGWKMGAISTALATSLSAFVNYWILHRYTYSAGWKNQFSLTRVIQLCFAGLFGLACTTATSYLFFDPHFFSFFSLENTLFSRSLTTQAAHFFIQTAAFSSGLFLYTAIFKNRDLLDVFQTYFFKKRTPESA